MAAFSGRDEARSCSVLWTEGEDSGRKDLETGRIGGE